jgi:hypothetical protein
MLLVVYVSGVLFIEAKKHINENIRKKLEVIFYEISFWNKLQ